MPRAVSKAIKRAIPLIAACITIFAPWFSSHAFDRVFPFPYTQEDFPNGLRLITVPTDSQNLISLYIVVQTGSRNEVEHGKSGFAHLFEHLMFRGTPEYPPEKYTAVIKRAGAASNASTSTDFTQFYTTFSKEDLPQILAMEADRFHNLSYTQEVFKTETGAVLGEFNKDAPDPSFKLNEVVHDTAYDRHTYKHTPMGFLKDVQDMPNEYDYSRQFFSRYYRPEYTTIVLAGDVTSKAVHPLVQRYWGNWKRGDYKADIPTEPAQAGPRENHIDWPSPTLPLIAVAYHGPAYSDTDKDWAALHLLSIIAFSNASDIYNKLVIREQKVDSLSAQLSAQVDPTLFQIRSRLKHQEDMQYVREQILATIQQFQTDLVPPEKLAATRDRERYSFVLGLDNSESVAQAVAAFVALRRSADTIEKLYAIYGQLTPQDIRAAAQRYLTDNNRTIVTLTGTGGEK